MVKKNTHEKETMWKRENWWRKTHIEVHNVEEEKWHLKPKFVIWSFSCVLGLVGLVRFFFS
jgi:hypothetical protein